MRRLSMLILALCVSMMPAAMAVDVTIISDNFDTDSHDSVPAIQASDVGAQWYLTHGSSPNSIRVIGPGAPAGTTGNAVRQSETFGTAFGHVETTSEFAALTTNRVVEVSYRMTMTSGGAGDYHGFHGSPLGSADLPGAPNGDDQLFIDAAYSVVFYGDGSIRYYSGGFVDPGITFIPAEWNDITLTVNLSSKSFDLSISNSSGTVAATGLGFRNASADSLKTVGFYQSGPGTTVAWVDDVSVTVDIPLAASGTVISDNFDTDIHDSVPAIQVDDVGAQWYLTHGSHPNSIRVIGPGAPAGSSGNVVRQSEAFGTAYGHVETTSELAALTAGQVVDVSYRMTMTSGGASDYHGFHGTPLGSADLPGAPFGDDQLFIDAAYSVVFYGDGSIRYYSGGFIDPGITFIPAEWNDISLTVDLANKLFDLSISNSSGTVAATGLGFRNAGANSLKTVGFYQSGPGTTVAWVDDVSVSVYIPPLGTTVIVR